MKRKDFELIALLRQNSRETLTKMSKKSGIPISTIYDKLKFHSGNLIKKHTSIIDFQALGFNARANVIIKVNRERRKDILDHFMSNQNINSVCKINNGYDFMFEAVYKNLREFEDYMDFLEEKFKVKNKEVYFIIDEPKKEGFMNDPNLIETLGF